MKLTTQREHLLGLLQHVIGVVERRQTLPILANVLLETHAGQVSLAATDLEVELSAHSALATAEDGRITLPGRKLLDILRALPDDAEISLGVEDQRAQLRCGRSRFALATLPADDMPTLDDFTRAADRAEITLRLPQKDLRTLIERTHFAMAQQDVRYYLNGLLLEVGDGYLRAVATDGHRLALYDIPAQTGSDSGRQVIVPRKGVQELLRLLADTVRRADETEVALNLSGNHIQIDLGNIRFTSKLIDGRFPDYQRAIPREGERVLVADRQLLRAALARAAILANENRGVRLQLEDWLLRVQANNPEQEEAVEEVEINYEGGPLEIGFNVSYLLDALGACNEELVKLFVQDGNSSCLIKAAEDTRGKYVISPMRL